MPVEKSAGAVIFRKENSKIYYLLLHYQSGHWDFPKGHIERGEKELDAVKREITEETGLKDIALVDGFKETIKYFFELKDETVLKFVTFYLAETKEERIKISHEHTGFKWLPYEEAPEQLTFKNAKEILQKANSFLSRQGL